MDDIASLNDLIRMLGSTAVGNRRLDAIIAYHCGTVREDAHQMVRLLIDEGSSWDLIFELMEGEIPAYSTVLDAAVPGENIVCSILSSKSQRWAAVHRTKAGGELLAWGESEVLARRIAGLKAILQKKQGKADSDRQILAPQRSAGPVRGVAAPALELPEVAEAEEDWKILF